MKKRIFATLLTAGLTTGMLPAASAAVDSGDANAYLKAMDNMPSASSYLVDFDGDGTDELLLWDNQSYDNKQYEVWDGSRKIAFGTLEYNQGDDTSYYEIARSKAEPDQLFLRYAFCLRNDNLKYFTYTVKNGVWSKVDDAKWSETYRDDMMVTDNHVNDYYFAGQSYVDHQLFQQMAAEMNDKYVRVEVLRANHSDRAAVLAALDTTSDGYKDVLSSLSSSECKALFDDFLYCVAGVDTGYIMPGRPSRGFDSRAASDGDIVGLLESLRMDTYFEISNDPFPQADFTKLTQQYFGRTIDYSKFATDHQPTEMDYGYSNLYYDGVFYLCWPQRGSNIELESLSGTPKQLYSLGSNRYCANFSITTAASSYAYSAVVKQNTDGTWQLVRLYPAHYTPTEAELAAFVAPSSWAQAEINAADAAGLIPELNGDPGWQDHTTRLQFAQLAVRLAEKATGQTLSVAPASTFADCNDLDVRKAYAAGIVSGTSDTTFSPANSLTREQLAAMLWRAAAYIQKQTGEPVLSAGSSLAGYTDAGRVSAYAKEAVASLAQHGIMKGTSATELSPQENCSVEQSILLTYRMMQKLF